MIRKVDAKKLAPFCSTRLGWAKRQEETIGKYYA